MGSTLLLRLSRRKSHAWMVVYIASAAILPYVHYTAFHILAAHAAYWAYHIAARQGERRALTGVGIVLALPVPLRPSTFTMRWNEEVPDI